MRRLALAALLVVAGTLAHAQMTTVTASTLVDTAHNPIATGTITFIATDKNGTPVQPHIGGGGLMMYRAATCLIVNGAITTQPGGAPCQVADTTLTNPANICYLTTIKDTVSRTTFPPYPCVQPSGSIWTLDGYVPAAPTGIVWGGGSGGPSTISDSALLAGSTAALKGLSVAQTFTGPILMPRPLIAASDAQTATIGDVRDAGCYSAKQWGAKCDGVTNDGPAISSALAWAHASNPFVVGACISLPHGSCYIGTPITWNGESLQGQGEKGTFLLQNPAGLDVLQTSDAATAGLFQEKGHISDFTVIMGTGSDTSYNGAPNPSMAYLYGLDGTGRYNRPFGHNTAFAPNQPGFVHSDGSYAGALPAWWAGGCAFASPSSGFPLSNLSNTVIERVSVFASSGTNRVGSGCGFYFAAVPYHLTLMHTHIAQTEHGFIEALPSNTSVWGSILFSPGTSSDTNNFEDIDISTATGWNVFLGTHQSWKNIHNYSQGRYQSSGCTNGHSAAWVIGGSQNWSGNPVFYDVRQSTFQDIYVEPGCLSTHVYGANATITTAMTPTSTSVGVSDIQQLTPTGQSIYIQPIYGCFPAECPGEWVGFTSITPGSGTTGTLNGLFRGNLGTTPAAHSVGDTLSNPAEDWQSTTGEIRTGNIKQGGGGVVLFRMNDFNVSVGLSGNDGPPYGIQNLGNQNTFDLNGISDYDFLNLGSQSYASTRQDNGSFDAATVRNYVGHPMRTALPNKQTGDWLISNGPYYDSLDDLTLYPENLTNKVGLGGSFGADLAIAYDVTAPLSYHSITVPAGTTINANRFNSTYNYLTFGHKLPIGGVNTHFFIKGSAAGTINPSIAGQTQACPITTSWSECIIPMDFSSQTVGATTGIQVPGTSVDVSYSAIVIAPLTYSLIKAPVNVEIAGSTGVQANTNVYGSNGYPVSFTVATADSCGQGTAKTSTLNGGYFTLLNDTIARQVACEGTIGARELLIGSHNYPGQVKTSGLFNLTDIASTTNVCGMALTSCVSGLINEIPFPVATYGQNGFNGVYAHTNPQSGTSYSTIASDMSQLGNVVKMTSPTGASVTINSFFTGGRIIVVNAAGAGQVITVNTTGSAVNGVVGARTIPYPGAETFQWDGSDWSMF